LIGAASTNIRVKAAPAAEPTESRVTDTQRAKCSTGFPAAQTKQLSHNERVAATLIAGRNASSRPEKHNLPAGLENQSYLDDHYEIKASQFR